MDQRAARLKDARIGAGYRTASDAARGLGMSIPTYSAHENGGRAFSVEDATVYAKRFGVSIDWLLTGHGDRTPSPMVPVRGTPVVGMIGSTIWQQRGPLDLDAEYPRQLQVALLEGAEARWFAVQLGEGKPPLPNTTQGDYLLCVAGDQGAAGDLFVIEVAGFNGTLHQLQVARQGAESEWLGWSERHNSFDHPFDEAPRPLGRVDAVYRRL